MLKFQKAQNNDIKFRYKKTICNKNQIHITILQVNHKVSSANTAINVYRHLNYIIFHSPLKKLSNLSSIRVEKIFLTNEKADFLQRLQKMFHSQPNYNRAYLAREPFAQ